MQANPAGIPALMQNAMPILDNVSVNSTTAQAPHPNYPSHPNQPQQHLPAPVPSSSINTHGNPSVHTPFSTSSNMNAWTSTYQQPLQSHSQNPAVYNSVITPRPEHLRLAGQLPESSSHPALEHHSRPMHQLPATTNAQRSARNSAEQVIVVANNPGSSNRQPIRRPSDSPRVQLAARDHANIVLGRWRPTLDTALNAMQGLLSKELLRVNDEHTARLNQLEALCRSLKRDLDASNAAAHKMFDDALAWKNKWAKGEELCAYYRHQLIQYQTVAKDLYQDRAKLQNELSELRAASLTEESKLNIGKHLASEELQKEMLGAQAALLCQLQMERATKDRALQRIAELESQLAHQERDDGQYTKSDINAIKAEPNSADNFSLSPTTTVSHNAVTVNDDFLSFGGFSAEQSQPASEEVEAVLKQELELIDGLTQSKDDCDNQRAGQSVDSVENAVLPEVVNASVLSSSRSTSQSISTYIDLTEELEYPSFPSTSQYTLNDVDDRPLKRARIDSDDFVETSHVGNKITLQEPTWNTDPSLTVQEDPPTCAIELSTLSQAEMNSSTPGMSTSHAETRPKRKLGILHFQLLYQRAESGSTCRICLKRSTVPNIDWPHVQRFPTDATHDELEEHIKNTHEEAYKQILNTPSHRLVEFRTRLVALDGRA